MKEKKKKVFFCTNCGNEYPKWSGQCHACGEWNTMREEYISKSESKSKSASTRKEVASSEPRLLQSIAEDESTRIILPDGELNRVLGGGVVPGSLILIGGQPGIGKSTLLLQTVLSMRGPILYVSGEESDAQIRMRAQRLNDQLADSAVYLLSETKVEKIIAHSEKINPELLVIDSIQTVSVDYVDSSQGSISQIRESAAQLQAYAKSQGVPIVLIGHITKEGSIAGPKLLEHIVDVVLQFEGDKLYTFRTMRSFKNRFGSTDEIGIYEMRSDGLHIIDNPSDHLIDQSMAYLSGSSIGAMLEGRRPMMIETQALVSKAVYGNPQRVVNGYDAKRISMLLAILEKRCGMFMNSQDVFINIAGGLKITDTAIDLALIAALMSSYENSSLSPKMCLSGEIGLGGEVRTVGSLELRLKEADRIGMEQFVSSDKALKGIDRSDYDIEIIGVKNVMELKERII